MLATEAAHLHKTHSPLGATSSDQVQELQRQLLLESSHVDSAASTQVSLDDVSSFRAQFFPFKLGLKTLPPHAGAALYARSLHDTPVATGFTDQSFFQRGDYAAQRGRQPI